MPTSHTPTPHHEYLAAVVETAARYPDHNAENPITVDFILDDLNRIGYASPEYATDVAALVNSCPADPFAGL